MHPTTWIGRSLLTLVLAAGVLAAPPGARAQLPASPDPLQREASPRAATSADANSTAAQGRRFWVKDRRFYYSDWYAGRHRKMIAFGCTPAPYYDPSPRCRRGWGFHHGLDVAMPCGTRLFSPFRTRVVYPNSSGSLGSAYGPHAFRLRSGRFGTDFVIGHVRRVFVRPGEIVRRGQLIARASNAAAPDGCHLHFEVRPRGTSYTSAIGPKNYIRLHLSR